MSESKAERPPTHDGHTFLDAPAEEFYAGFEPYFCFESFDVRRRAVPASGLFEYKVRGTFPTPMSTLLAVYMDFEYRQTWDPHCLTGSMLGSSDVAGTEGVVKELFASGSPTKTTSTDGGEDSGVDMGSPNSPTLSLIEKRLEKLTLLHSTETYYHYAIRMPFPLATRDYVYTIKTFTDASNHRLIENVASTHSKKPEVKGTIRIEDFYQQIAVKALETKEGKVGCMLAMRYYDNPRGSIPAFVLNMAASKGVPSFINGLIDACDKYEGWLAGKM
ncbi:hypothetical protein HDV05_001269 [Chytridiales sp. JEL 0842]|nr:hypothetical protein HDV05_001269 [Chytridiales sp. JEL 0842]